MPSLFVFLRCTCTYCAYVYAVRNKKIKKYTTKIICIRVANLQLYANHAFASSTSAHSVFVFLILMHAFTAKHRPAQKPPPPPHITPHLSSSFTCFFFSSLTAYAQPCQLPNRSEKKIVPIIMYTCFGVSCLCMPHKCKALFHNADRTSMCALH